MGKVQLDVGDRQILVMMLGVPGSGKSTFARQLAESLAWRRISTDAIKTELFGRPDPNFQKGVSQSQKRKYQLATLRLLEHRVRNSLLAGHSVIRDHMHHRHDWREIGRRQAALVGALPVLVWIKTPYDLAHKRGMTRKFTSDQRVETNYEKMHQIISFWHEVLEEPRPEEVCLEIDGQIDFEQQLEQFIHFCQKHLKTNVKAKLQKTRPALSARRPAGSQDRQVVIIMFGTPGSGKTSFCRRLESEFGWQRLNRVALRQELFGSTVFPELVKDKKHLEEALDIRLRNIIHSGQSVICDYKHSRKYERDYAYALAKDAGALPILVWMQTPVNVAIERGNNRRHSYDSIKSSHSHMRRIIENDLRQREVPSDTEPLLILNGLSNPEKHLASFYKFYKQQFRVS